MIQNLEVPFTVEIFVPFPSFYLVLWCLYFLLAFPLWLMLMLHEIVGIELDRNIPLLSAKASTCSSISSCSRIYSHGSLMTPDENFP
jgi:hypothetical protein